MPDTPELLPTRAAQRHELRHDGGRTCANGPRVGGGLRVAGVGGAALPAHRDHVVVYVRLE
jgi:hypothetical protein